MSEELKRLKPYKTSLPYDTVQKIRKILFEHNIFLIEVASKSKVSNTYSNRIVVADEGLETLDIGTNGKGMIFKLECGTERNIKRYKHSQPGL